MANNLIDNTYLITDTSTTALTWPTNPYIQSVVFSIANTASRAIFLVAANSVICTFTMVTQASMGSTIAIPGTYSVVYGGVRFPTAWIPSIMSACTAWINFA